MKITKEQIKALGPCAPGWEWYLANGTEDLLETLLKLNDHRPEWARWLFAHLMTLQQKRRIAIFAAEQVLEIFEKHYPEDKRPRNAIEAAKVVLENDTPENRNAAADAAAYAAYAAAYAAYAAAAYAAYAAYAAAAYAADAAYAAAAAAAYAAAYAAANAAYAAADARKQVQEQIIREAVRILDEQK